VKKIISFEEMEFGIDEKNENLFEFFSDLYNKVTEDQIKETLRVIQLGIFDNIKNNLNSYKVTIFRERGCKMVEKIVKILVNNGLEASSYYYENHKITVNFDKLLK
jgi:hypothetical protein